MRSFITSVLAAVALIAVSAGAAFGAHCINQSKVPGAGAHGTVIVNAVTGETSFIGANAAGRLPGGFADVWLDFDGDGVGDQQIEEEVFLISNHSFRDNPGQGTPGVLPPAERNPGGDHGVGVAD